MFYRPLPSGGGFLLTTQQPTQSRIDQGDGEANLARYGEPESSDSVEVLQGSRRIRFEQHVSGGELCGALHSSRADIFSDAWSGADPRFCGVLAGWRDRLPPLERATVRLTPRTRVFRSFNAASG